MKILIGELLMKKYKYLLLVLPLAVFLSLYIYAGCSDNGDDHAEKDLVYYCPMHPEVISDKPGVCPICHMDLVLKDQDGDDMSQHLAEGLNLSDSKVILANISVVQVKEELINQKITAYSYLDFAEQSRKFITARFNGRIEKLLVDRIGTYVKKGDPLFEVYSPDLIQAQNDYLLSVSGNSLSPGLSESNGNNENKVLEASRQKLQLMGVTSAQLSELEKSKNVAMTLTYFSTVSGVVIEKKVQEGMYVNEGTLIYEVADMSTLWNIAEIYENDLGNIQEGGKVSLTLKAYPGEIFEGKVDLIYPVINSQSRTVKVRSVIPNRNGKLKPNMYGEASFQTKTERGILVPEEAVLMTGERKIVWVQIEKGKFEYRVVETGRKVDGMFEILSGLREGEFVAASGGFLIDSESQLRGGTGAVHNHGEESNEDDGSSLMNEQDKQNKFSNNSQIIDKTSEKIWNSICPVIGGEVDSEVKTVVYKDKIIGFCCPGCDEDFIKDPEKYLSNLNKDGTKYISIN